MSLRCIGLKIHTSSECSREKQFCTYANTASCRHRGMNNSTHGSPAKSDHHCQKKLNWKFMMCMCVCCNTSNSQMLYRVAFWGAQISFCLNSCSCRLWTTSTSPFRFSCGKCRSTKQRKFERIASVVHAMSLNSGTCVNLIIKSTLNRPYWACAEEQWKPVHTENDFNSWALYDADYCIQTETWRMVEQIHSQ